MDQEDEGTYQASWFAFCDSSNIYCPSTMYQPLLHILAGDPANRTRQKKSPCLLDVYVLLGETDDKDGHV